MTLLVTGLGGALGALGRYWLTLALSRRLPAGGLSLCTLAVNTAGSLLLGLLIGALFGSVPRTDALLADRNALFFGVGFCGAFTTFSTFATDVVGFMGARRPGRVVAYVVATLGMAVAAFAAGLTLAS